MSEPLKNEHIQAIWKLTSEIAISMEAIGICGRGFDVAVHVLAVMADLGWELTPPAGGETP